MVCKVIYKDGLMKKYTNHRCIPIEHICKMKTIIFDSKIKIINLSYYQITSSELNKIIFPKFLQHLYLYDTQISSLENVVFPEFLQVLTLNCNQISSLENVVFPASLHRLYLADNQILSLKNVIFPESLQGLHLACNQISSLENVEFPTSLQTLYLFSNQISSLKNVKFPPSLQYLYLSYNQIQSLPIYLIHSRIVQFHYSDNPIEYIPIPVRRWLNRRKNSQIIQVYNDGQNVHNHAIQDSVRTSIEKVMSQHFPSIDYDTLRQRILSDTVLTKTSKESLIEYCHIQDIHSMLQLTFEELLGHVWKTIESLTPLSCQTEVKQILNEELKDSQCKCFTGRMSRLINCLNGFTPLVEIQINDNHQIGNIVILVKEHLLQEENYSVENHKKDVEKELIERGYTRAVIDEWIEYIE